jgi:hypothetical protein
VNSLEKERFAKWQSKTIEQLSTVLSLVVLLSSGHLAYTIDSIITRKICPAKYLSYILLIAIILHFIVIGLVFLTTYLRYIGFRLTSQIIKSRTKNDQEELNSLLSKSRENDARVISNVELIFWVFISGTGVLALAFLTILIEK